MRDSGGAVMSAFLVSKATIDAIVTAYVELGGRLVDVEERRSQANAIGEMLWRENNRSVNYRYRERTYALAYEYEACPLPARIIDIVPILGELLACYEYQSCEHPGWERSEARAFVQDMRAAALAALPHPECWDTGDRNVFVDRPIKAVRS